MSNYQHEVNNPQVVVHGNDPGLNYQRNINNNHPENANFSRDVINGAHLNANRIIEKPKKKNFLQRTTKSERIIAMLSIIAIIIFIVLLVIGDGLSNYEPPLVVAKKYGNLTLELNENESNNMTPVYNLTEVYYVTDKNLPQFKIPPPQDPNDSLQNHEDHGDFISICNSVECNEAAANILDFIDQNVDPCDDFYDYACGNFLNKTVIPNDKTSVNVFSLLEDKLHEQIKSVVTEEHTEDDIEPFKMAKKFYKGCMNKELIDQLQFEPLTNITEALGGWPVLKGKDWNEEAWNLQDILVKFRNYGLNYDYLFDVTVQVNFKDSLKRIMELDQATLLIEREYLVKGMEDFIVVAYYHYMVDVAVILGADGEEAEDELEDSLLFEIELAKICLPIEQRRNLSQLFHSKSIVEFQASYPYFDWLTLINGLSTIQVDENEIINDGIPEFFLKLGNLLKNTPKRTIANYLMWRVHAGGIFYLTEELRDKQLEFASKINGNKERKPRWRECVEATKALLPKAISALYVRKYFPKEAKISAVEMVKELRNSFKTIITEVDWMDDTTKQTALLKLEKLTAHVAFPDELLDDEKLKDYYKNLEIDENAYYRSGLRVQKLFTNKNFDKLRKPVNKTDWETHANVAQINAFYNILENSVNIPAGILQSRFFSPNRPSYLNFGGIGYVIGHEITHGFDDQGRQFNDFGNLADWWAPQTKKAFEAKAQHIIEQYGNFTEDITGEQVNGVITQGESIADIGGVKESYNAFINWINVNGDEAKLPGLEAFTSKQMFWINSAQIWCAKVREETLRKILMSDAHPPGKFRVIGPFSNRKEFAEDFNCPEGSKMNPSIKNNVW